MKTQARGDDSLMYEWAGVAGNNWWMNGVASMGAVVIVPTLVHYPLTLWARAIVLLHGQLEKGGLS